ncbi:MAG: hypothetical protein V1710_06685 [Candidatus Bathyarchaeota archaeon]
MTITGVNDDGDSLCETGEKFKVVIDFSQLTNSTMEPDVTLDDAYAHPYEEFRIELRTSTGAVLSIVRQLPAVYTTIMVLD